MTAHRPDYVLGIDPGAVDTGLCLRNRRGDVLDHDVVARRDGQPIAAYLAAVAGAVRLMAEPETVEVYHYGSSAPISLGPMTGCPASPARPDQPRGTLVIAVEDVLAPTGHARNRRGHLINPGPLLVTATVLGAILGAYPRAVLVRPGSHGSGPLAAYPPALRGPRETRLNAIGKGRLRHARSAYDIAGAAGLYHDPPYGVLPRQAPTMH